MSVPTEKISQDMSSVLALLSNLVADPDDAIRCLESVPIRVLGQRTLYKAIQDGDTEKVIRYLQSISGGQGG